MPFRYYSPGAFIFALGVVAVMSALSSAKKKIYSQKSNSTSSEHNHTPTIEQENISAMRKVVSEYEGYTAEVIDINVFGRRRVETFRLLSPGRKVELKMKNDDIKVFAYGEYIADLIPKVGSNLPRLFNENISFDAYLGGRNRAFIDDDTYDLCSIIVFYKLDGVPPTKVNLY